MQKPFGSVCVGQVFTYNGTWWRKCSKRTAESLDRQDTWFFFRKNEVVVPS
jgi:hypothetical protein